VPLICKSFFNFFKRKHHCRACGLIFCNNCSLRKTTLKQIGYDEPVRVCNNCSQNFTFKSTNLLNPFDLSPKSPKLDFEVKEWFLLINNDKEDILKSKVFEGIPHRLRSQVWPLISGSHDLKYKNPGVYKYFVSRLDRIKCKEELDNDIKRTYPELVLFNEENGPGQKALYNVLGSFSLFDSEIGYHQGMNFIVAILLMQMDEENAFWLFIQLMKSYEINQLFKGDSDYLQKWMKEFDKWFQRTLPKLYHHFKAEMVVFEIYITQWFRTIFSYSFPLEMIFRIWDVFLVEGTDFLLWVALALFNQSEDQLLTMNTMEIMKYFTKLPETTFGALLNQFQSQM